MPKKIYTDKEGKEFFLKEDFINKGDEKQKVYVGMEPVLNPDGKQVIDPVLHYDYLENKNLNLERIADSKYPYLVFGSEFTGAEVQPLPTPFTNTIDEIAGSSRVINGIGPYIKECCTEKVIQTYENSSMNSIDTIANALFDQCIHSINQNMIALYNNNLRVILSTYLYDKNDECKLNISLLRNDGSLPNYILTRGSGIMDSGLPSPLIKINFEEHKIVPRSDEESFIMVLDLANTIYYNLSCVYYELINRVANTNIVNFGKLAMDRLGQNSCDPSYMYSSGIDFANEIANMECGILANVVEINVMNMMFQFQDIMKYIGINELPDKEVN